MAYTKKTWENGDAITPTNLNNMEDGIADIHSRIQSGVATFGPINAGELKNFTITFPTSFATTPAVTLTVATFSPNLLMAGIYSVNATTLLVSVKNNHTAAYSTFNIHWIAIQP